jgi:hypothetical protein
MKMDDSQQLLADYVKNGSESAFQGLVTLYVTIQVLSLNWQAV